MKVYKGDDIIDMCFDMELIDIYGDDADEDAEATITLFTEPHSGKYGKIDVEYGDDVGHRTFYIKSESIAKEISEFCEKGKG